MRAFSRPVLGPALLALGVAEAGARVLTPRERPAPVAKIDLGAYFSQDEIERGARYARAQLALGLARSGLELALLGALTLRLRKRRARLPQGAAAGAVMAAALAVGGTAASLPLAAVSRRRAIGVGLVTQSSRGWAVDVAKSTAIESALAALAGGVVVVLQERDSRRWWLRAAGGFVVFGTLLGALAPVLLDPLFNDFTPLPEGPLRTDVLELAAASDVRVGEVYSVDASRRTTAANAYVTGLGPTKRVVLFDTLIDRYSRDEVRTVIAHELAHVRHRDVLRGVLYGAVVAGPVALATQRVAASLTPEATGPGALPGLALAAAVMAAPAVLIGNRLSRALERRADAFALALSEAPEAFISFERAIALQNVADLDPPAWVTRILASHPPTAERIGAAVAAIPGCPRTRAGS